jgi:hypothetical protein
VIGLATGHLCQVGDEDLDRRSALDRRESFYDFPDGFPLLGRDEGLGQRYSGMIRRPVGRGEAKSVGGLQVSQEAQPRKHLGRPFAGEIPSRHREFDLLRG